MKTAILVPARLASTRLPEKMLHGIHGKPVLRWVAERIRDEVPELPLFFAVDDERHGAQATRERVRGGIHVSIERGHDGDMVLHPAQRLGKRSADVGERAVAAVGGDLTGDEGYFHGGGR